MLTMHIELGSVKINGFSIWIEYLKSVSLIAYYMGAEFFYIFYIYVKDFLLLQRIHMTRTTFLIRKMKGGDNMKKFFVAFLTLTTLFVCTSVSALAWGPEWPPIDRSTSVVCAIDPLTIK